MSGGAERPKNKKSPDYRIEIKQCFVVTFLTMSTMVHFNGFELSIKGA